MSNTNTGGSSSRRQSCIELTRREWVINVPEANQKEESRTLYYPPSVIEDYMIPRSPNATCVLESQECNVGASTSAVPSVGTQDGTAIEMAHSEREVRVVNDGTPPGLTATSNVNEETGLREVIIDIGEPELEVPISNAIEVTELPEEISAAIDDPELPEELSAAIDETSAAIDDPEPELPEEISAAIDDPELPVYSRNEPAIPRNARKSSIMSWSSLKRCCGLCDVMRDLMDKFRNRPVEHPKNN